MGLVGHQKTQKQQKHLKNVFLCELEMHYKIDFLRKLFIPIKMSDFSKFCEIQAFVQSLERRLQKTAPDFNTRIWFNHALCACMNKSVDWPPTASYHADYKRVARKFRKLWDDEEPRGNTLPFTEDQFAEVMAIIAERDETSDSASDVSYSDSDSDSDSESECIETECSRK